VGLVGETAIKRNYQENRLEGVKKQRRRATGRGDLGEGDLGEGDRRLVTGRLVLSASLSPSNQKFGTINVEWEEQRECQ
jgi:hypothetical protein